MYGLFDFLGKAGAIILVPLYAKMLGPAEYGMLELFTVTGAFLLIASVMGFNSALTRYYVTEELQSERDKFFQTAFLSVLLMAGIIALVLSLSSSFVSNIFFGTNRYAFYWRLLFVTVVFDSATTISLALYRSQTKPGLYSGINFTKLVLTLVLNVVFVGFLKQGIYGVLIGNLIGSACGLIFSFVFSARIIKFEFSRRCFILMAKFGLPLLVSGFAFFIINSADRYFLRIYTTLANLGAYALGYKVGMLMSLAVNAFVVAWMPLMFKIAGDAQAKRTFATVMTYYLFLTFGILIGVGSFSHEIVRLIGTPEYSAAGGIIIFVLVSYLFQGAYYIMTTGALLKDQTKVILIVAGISAVINISANFLLIPTHGIKGAAVATVISYAFLPAAMYFASQRYYRINFEKLRILKMILSTGVILVVNNILIGHGRAVQAETKLVIVLFYPVALLALGFFTSEELTRGKLVFKKVVRLLLPTSK